MSRRNKIKDFLSENEPILERGYKMTEKLQKKTKRCKSVIRQVIAKNPTHVNQFVLEAAIELLRREVSENVAFLERYDTLMLSLKAT
jgi:hypothetical protein